MGLKAGWWNRAVWFGCVLAWAVFLIRVAVPAARTPNTNGFVAYYTAARTLLETPSDLPRLHDEPLFQARIDQLFQHHVIENLQGQPPPICLILAPLAWLGPPAARALWTGFSVALWVAGLAVLASALEIRSRRIPVVALISALSTLYTPLADNLRRGQAYVLLYFLLCLAVKRLIRARGGDAASGVPLGLMAVLKAAGLWLWPLLLVARRGRALLVTVATAALVALVSAPLFGWAMWRTYLLDARWLASNPAQHVTAYQTVVSLTGHLFVFEATWNPTPVAHLPLLAWSLAVLITCAALWASIWFQRLDHGDAHERALSVGLFVSLIVSLTPLAEGYHYVLVFPALLIAFWWALRAPATRPALVALVCCAALLSVPQVYYGSQRLQRGWLALLAYPRVYGAFGLWAWLANALRHTSSRASSLDRSLPIN